MSSGTIEAVYEAVESNRLDRLRTLLPMAPDAIRVLKCGSGRFIEPLLIYAAENGKPEIVKFLVGVKGINIEIAGKLADATPLNRAIVEENRWRHRAEEEKQEQRLEKAKEFWEVAERCFENAKILLEAGANPDKKCDDTTPLCRLAGSPIEADRMFKLLIEHGADANITSNGGVTPLMTAARAGIIDRVELLIGIGAHIDLKDNRGYTALDYARAGKDEACIKFLESQEDKLRQVLAPQRRKAIERFDKLHKPQPI